MNLFALMVYGLVNVVMILYHFLPKGRLYEYPLWAGVLGLGWFFPMAVGGYKNILSYPDGAFVNGLLFASLCTLATWLGHAQALAARPRKASWLDAQFRIPRLNAIGAFYTLFGLYFYWKLMSLPEEILSMTQWTGAAVKYLFLSSVFKFGFIALWMVYAAQKKWVKPQLIFLIPGLLLLLEAALLRGRRGEMLNLIAYIFITLWFVRRLMLPRWFLALGLVGGMALVNSVGIYRSIMKQEDLPLAERLEQVSRADYTTASKELLEEGGSDFNNYIYFRQVTEEDRAFDFGLKHWNNIIGNYVPSQLVGRAFKDSLKIEFEHRPEVVSRERYGHQFSLGGVATGYYDAFASFSWLGFIKFWLVGWLMGILYRRGMAGSFLGAFLYVFMLNAAMHSISHGTNKFLVQMWGYFFTLIFPVFYLAKVKIQEPLPD